MRRTFQRRLMVLMALAFAVTMLSSWLLQSRHERQDALGLIRFRLQEAREEIAQQEADLDQIRKASDESLREKLRVLRWILSRHPELGESDEGLRSLMSVIDVDQIHVTDARGVITATTYAPYLGYALDSSPQSAFFLPVLKDSKLLLVQEAMPTGFDQDTMMQFAAAGIPGQTGMVQIGNVPQRLAEAMSLADITRLAPGFAIGARGTLLVIQDGLVVSAGDRNLLGKKIEELGFSPDEALGGSPFDARQGSQKALALAEESGQALLVGMMPYGEVYAGRNETLMILGLAYLLLFAGVFALVSHLVEREVISGIHAVNGSLAKITAGDLETRVLVDRNEEFRALSGGINATVDALKRSIEEAKTRIDSELALARAVQMANLPSVDSLNRAFPNLFRLGAMLAAAREVGGDFYDSFVVDAPEGRKLAIVMADVSGKGIAGALFMMRVKTQLRSDILASVDLESAMTRANQRLCEENAAGLFVTAFAGLWDFEGKGWLSYVNAGHNPPLLARTGEGHEWVSGAPDLVLGAMEGSRYHARRLRLVTGDRLFLYTDGVTEAQNRAGEFFSANRLREWLGGGETRNLPADTLPQRMMDTLTAYAAGREQADDITLLALDVLESPAALPVLHLPLEEESLPRLQELISGESAAAGVPAGMVDRLHILADEVFSNLVNHGGGPGAQAAVSFEVAGQEAVLRFADRGAPFDPLAQPLPDTDLPAERRDSGGLGILLVRKLADRVDYGRVDGENRLILRVSTAPRRNRRQTKESSDG